MGIITAVSRYILPFLAVTLLAKCVLTLLLGHPREKIYGYITDIRSGERHPLNMWETSIGRSKSSDITLRYGTISRTHAVISRRLDGWYIFDINSKSGIRVNGKLIEKKATVSNGDTVSFANMAFRFEITDDPVQPAGKHKKKSAPQKTAPAADSSRIHRATDIQYHPRMISLRTSDTYVLIGNRVTIGSSAKSDIRLTGRGISRTHSVLVLYEDGWAITDANSTNGTLLNGRRISAPQLLFDGDVLTFGSEQLHFRTRR